MMYTRIPYIPAPTPPNTTSLNFDVGERYEAAERRERSRASR